MLLLVDNEVDSAYGYFIEEMARFVGDYAEYEVYDYAERGGRPDLDGVDGVVIGGSTAGVYEADDYPWMAEQRAFVRELVAEEVPTLGVCFGHQMINAALGGRVEHRGLKAELVSAEFEDDPLFDGVSGVVPAVHGDAVVERGDGMEVVGSADYYGNFATRHRDAPVWTVQYHPEFTDSLLERIAADFGWTENHRDFADATNERTLENFSRLAARY